MGVFGKGGEEAVFDGILDFQDDWGNITATFYDDICKPMISAKIPSLFGTTIKTGFGAIISNSLGVQNSWDINGPKTVSKWQGPNNSTYSEFGSDNTVWSKSRSEHADSYKVYDKTSKGLEWKADADKYGNYIDPAKKHKSPKGKFISWKKLKKLF